MIKTEQFQIHAYDSDRLRIVTTNTTLANRVNKAFNAYPGYKIKDREEPVYSIRASDIEKLAELMPRSICRRSLKILCNVELKKAAQIDYSPTFFEDKAKMDLVKLKSVK